MRYIGAIAALGLISGICGGSVTPNTPPNPVLPLKVRSYGCKLTPAVSTGFAIDGGWVVTAAHATRGSTSIEIEGTTAALVAIDLRSDVAILRPTSLANANSDNSDRPARLVSALVGDAATVTVRRDEGPQVFIGEVQRVLTINFEEPLDDKYYKRHGLTVSGVALRHGDSGTAVVGPTGDVIGLMFAMSNKRDIGYAVRSDEIAALIPARPNAAPVDSLRC